MKKIFLLIIIFCFGCKSDFLINDLNGAKLDIKLIQKDNIVMLGSNFCSECMVNLIQYLKKYNKSFIVVYPSEGYNNLIKITMNTVLSKQKVDSSLIYWVEKEIYNSKFQNWPSPFIIDNKNHKIIKYNFIFNNDGTVKKTFLK